MDFIHHQCTYLDTNNCGLSKLSHQYYNVPTNTTIMQDIVVDQQLLHPSILLLQILSKHTTICPYFPMEYHNYQHCWLKGFIQSIVSDRRMFSPWSKRIFSIEFFYRYPNVVNGGCSPLNPREDSLSTFLWYISFAAPGEYSSSPYFGLFWFKMMVKNKNPSDANNVKPTIWLDPSHCLKAKKDDWNHCINFILRGLPKMWTNLSSSKFRTQQSRKKLI